MNEIQFCQRQLEANLHVFKYLFKKTTSEMVTWRPVDKVWCMLEIVCHLVDEEIEDFRQRTRWTIDKPNTTPPPIDPVGWVKSRNYINQNFEAKTNSFVAEREHSLQWLSSLDTSSINWQSGYTHPKLGFLTAKYFITNWVAHDHHHIRQINRLQYAYLREIVGEDLVYAGNHKVFSI